MTPNVHRQLNPRQAPMFGSIRSQISRRTARVGIAGLAAVAVLVPVAPAGAVRGGEPDTSTPFPVGTDLWRECGRYASQGVDTAECVRQAAIARDATAKYRNVTAALADGFVPTGECEETTLGAMGQHWARIDRMAIDGVDPRTPEILLYVPSGPGLKLVAVEYAENASVGGLPYFGSQPPDAGKVTPPPAMFGGRTFDGPMQGHVAIQPWHYDLHVWLWERNPAGMFAHYNPRVSC